MTLIGPRTSSLFEALREPINSDSGRFVLREGTPVSTREEPVFEMLQG